MLYNITQESVIRFIVFAVFTSANLFILPQIIDFEDFVVVFGRVTALLVVIGFLPYLGLPTAAGPFDLTLWGGKLYWYPALQPITSIFVAVNWLGFLTLSGSIFALGEWWMFKSNVSKVILGVNTLGLLFTNYRAGWVGFLVAVGILFIYVLFDREGVKLAILGGIIATIVALAMMFEIIPGPAVLSELSLNHRRGSWIAAAQILQEQPFLGYGFGNTAAVLSGVVPPGSPANVHNSHIRAFLALGLGGGLTYLGLFLATLLKGASRVTTKSDMILLMGLLSYLVVQLFNSLSFIGLSLHSVIIAIMMGYQVME
jgi:O-antigen ligase